MDCKEPLDVRTCKDVFHRLSEGERQYGDKTLEKSVFQICKEIDEELVDAVAYASMCFGIDEMVAERKLKTMIQHVVSARYIVYDIMCLCNTTEYRFAVDAPKSSD